MAEHAHIALVRKGYEAFSRGDTDTLTQIISHDAVQHVGGDNIFTGDYKGIEAILSYYARTMEETNGTFRVELESLSTDGRGHVISRHHVTASRGDKSLDARGCLFFEILNDQAVDLVQCSDDLEADDRFWS